MLVRDVMTTPVVTIHATMSIKDGLRLLDEHHVTSLPVTDADGRLVGIVSEADLLRDAVRPDSRTSLLPHDVVEHHPTRVEEVMTTSSLTVAVDDDLSEAVAVMTTHRVKSMPVVEEGRVVGVVSRSDVVHMLARGDEQIRSEVDELLRSAELDARVEVSDGEVTVSMADDPATRRIARTIAESVAGVITVHVRS
jgi:CBS domain-containing protein